MLRRLNEKERFTPFLLLGPALLLMLLIVAYPLFQALRLSLFDASLLRPDRARFVGLTNYLNVLRDPLFLRSLLNSTIWVVGCVTLQFTIGMLGALLLNREFPGRGLVRGLSLIPWATSGVLVSLMWTWMLDGNYGVINDILVRLGLISQYRPWLALPISLGGVIAANVWQGAPFFAVMLLAAMQSVPQELYEAARIDGAGRFQQFRSVTIPLIMPTIVITTMLRIVWTANYMDLVFVMTGGGPGNASIILPVLSYITAYKKLKVGEATAMAVLQAILLIITLFVYLRLVNRKGEGGLSLYEV
ncbi:MAG: sugar ABC transporter permease [Limnochordia bacterium]|jgi:multiple sugar transport system permease protein|nr:sugar ABC transporter permease [Limnochordia bacterium]